jgi:hypothetical protein
MFSLRRLILFLGFTLTVAYAQSPLGTITGLATDPSGAPVAGASVTIANTQTAAKTSAKTNDAGVYSFPNLAPAEYKLNASANGFREIASQPFTVRPFTTVRQDLHLELASTGTQVTVTASAASVIQAETPSIALDLTAKQIIELPTNLRSIYDNSGDSGLIFTMLPELVPGVVQVGSGAKWITPGGLASGTKLKVDGIETDFGNFGAPDPVSQPSFETVDEFTANLMTNKAEFGGIGTITTTTKSGTNQLHYDLFWYAHNSEFDARNPFLTSKSFTNLHNYGIYASGPIRKDKTFFTFVYDGTRGVRGYPFVSNVPTVAQRAGDFTGSAALKNPYTAFNPFSGNTIIPSYLSPQALKLQQQFYPLPNYGPANSTSGNYRASFNGPEFHHIVEGRLDQNFSERHSAFLRYQWKKDDYQIPGARSALPPQSTGTSTNVRRVNFFTLGDVFTPTPNVSNEFRAGVVILVSASSADLTGQQVLDAAGIAGLPPRGGIYGIPNISVTGLTTVTQSLLSPVNDGHSQVSDNLSWIKGRHTFKFGAEFVDWFVNRYLTTNSGLFGNYSFQGGFTGNPYADFLLGLPTSVVRLDPWPAQYNRWWDFAAYAQDDWKISPRLTLSYGLRYEYNQPVHAENDNIYSFNLATGQVVIPSENARKLISPYFPSTLPLVTADKVGLNNTLRHGDKNNFAPRIGLSWQLDPKTVIRSGAGFFYAHFSGNIATALGTGPFAVSTTNTNSFTNGQPLFTLANPFANPGNPGTLNLTAVTPNLLNPVVYQYTFTVERQVTDTIGARISYIGSHGTQLAYERNANTPMPSTVKFTQSARPYPLFGNIIYGDSGATSSYNALQVQVQKRFSRGLLFSSAWTWAKELSDVDDTGDFELNTQIENPYNRSRDRGNVYSVPRHQWENQFIYDLPFGHNVFVRGWQVNGVLNMSSGNWLNPQFSGVDTSNTNTVGGRPDIVAPITYPGTVNGWFSTSSFAVPANGTFGNAARNSIQGPGWILANAGLSRTFKLERFGAIQLGATFQNILNHENLGEPNLVVNNVNGGKITSTAIFPPAGSPRTGQLLLRWSF